MLFYGFLSLLLIVFISVAFVALQIYLSKRKSRYPGLVLPILLLILILLPSILSYTIRINQTNELPDNESIAEVSEGIWPVTDNRTRITYPRTGDSTSISYIFLFGLLYDAALFIIYFVVRKNITPDKKVELKRMSVQDL